MVTSLCMCGYIELKPSQASTGSLFQMQGFTLPQPSGRGTSVRNIQSFHVSASETAQVQAERMFSGVAKHIPQV
jgi:hypothetical protein